MTEPDSSLTQTKGKIGKAKAVFKRRRSEAPSETSGQDPQVIARIQQRAYWLYEAGGFEHGHDLEHWLEAERQVTDSSRELGERASTEPA